MTFQEEIAYNIENNIHFIEVDSENRAIKAYVYKANDNCIQIEWDDSIIMDMTSATYLYVEELNTVQRVDFDYFSEYRTAVAKEAKIKDVAKITVTTTSSKVFDGDEVSQDRMVRAVQIAGITAQTTTNWKMADNSIVEVTLDELKEALALAGQAMSEIWLA
jgi:hypothetical protein